MLRHFLAGMCAGQSAVSNHAEFHVEVQPRMSMFNRNTYLKLSNLKLNLKKQHLVIVLIHTYSARLSR